MNYVETYINAFESAISASDFTTVYNNKTVGYSQLFDMDSLVQFWMVNELFMNVDAMKKSTYMYKDIDGLFHMGPIWDMDFSSRSVTGFGLYDQWAVLHLNDVCQETMWYKALVKDEIFIERAFELYQQYRPVFWQLAEENGVIDGYYDYLYESAMANEKLWLNGRAFTEDVEEYLKPWFQERLAWMDAQFVSAETLMRSLNPD